MKKINVVKIAFILLVLLLNIISCKKDSKYINVAFLTPQINATIGDSVNNSVLMALEEINNNGGVAVNVNGKKVNKKFKLEYVNEDIGSIMELSNKLRKTIEEKNCKFIIGGRKSKIIVPLMDVMAEKKVIWLGVGGASSAIVARVKKNHDKYKYYFRVGTIDSALQGKAIGDFAYKHFLPKGLTKVAYLSLNQAFSRYIIEIAKNRMDTYGFKTVLQEDSMSIKTDYNKLVDDILNSKADFVITNSISKEAELFIRAAYAKKLNEKISIIAAIAEITVDNYPKGNDLIKWYIGMQPQSGPIKLTKDGTSLKFAEKYFKKYKAEPIYLSYPAYDTLYILKEGIEKSNSLNSDKIVNKMESDDFEFSHIIRYKWHKDNHDLFVGNHNGKTYATINWFQFMEDGKRYFIYPDVYKQKNIYLPGLNRKNEDKKNADKEK